MNDDQFKILNELVIMPLKNNGCSVYIFGSRSTPHFHAHSDVDLLYSSKKELPMGLISTIKDNIEDSRFPFHVDLVDEKELASSYRDSVYETRVLI